MRSEDILISGARELDITLSPAQVGLFKKYMENILLWNEKVNLTSIIDEDQIIISHFLDSISISRLIHDNSKVLDLGSGAGFPGIPLKIVNPSLELTLLESVQKKVFFLLDLIRKLKLEKIDAIWGRAESLENNVPRNYFDVVTSRAFGDIKKIVGLSIPYVVERGKIILMRGRKGIKEWEEARCRIDEFLKLIDLRELELPFRRGKRVILVLARDL